MKRLKLLLSALLLFTACEKEEVAPKNPLEGWEGEYFTQTNFWGAYFSPIVIEEDGSLLVAGTEVEYEFDEMTNTFSFDWTNIKTTEAKSSFSFEQHGENKILSGSINPRRQDGGVSLRGGITPYTVWSGTYQT
ncbi:hypothetical protein WJR50_06020 [Catalinimonas sp. 4WD22]|uniref:hypothetical protein n=1 Tax=Catalinimonas locisalis TaxID=3133978 RepID=UPI003100DF85